MKSGLVLNYRKSNGEVVPLDDEGDIALNLANAAAADLLTSGITGEELVRERAPICRREREADER